ncbi:MAG: hypothetical protein AAF533_07690 [Acidobacteriota bacterium]
MERESSRPTEDVDALVDEIQRARPDFDLGQGWQLLADRRGTLVLQLVVQGERAQVLKIGQAGPHAGFGNDPAQLVRREAEVLRAIPEGLGPVLFASGECTGAAWLLMERLSGHPLHEAVRPGGREGPVSLVAIREAVQACARLHAAGWLHGDLQPAHFRWSEAGVRLLDFGLARGPGEQPGYRGALVHFVSPAVAAGMQRGDADIEYALADEIFALGATLFFVHVRQTVHDYGDEPASFESKLRCLVDGVGRRGFDLAPTREPRLEEVIEHCLQRRPADRPASLEELLPLLE